MAIRSEEIADLSGFIQQLKEALAVTKQLQTELTSGLKNAAGGAQGKVNIVDAESFKKAAKATTDLNAATQQLAATRKQIAALERKLAQATSASAQADKEKESALKRLKVANSSVADETAVINEQLRIQKKANKEAARETLGLVGAYEKESKRLIALRKQFKDLIIVEGKATKETDALEKEITQLDAKLKRVDAAAGQFQRNVGNYSGAMKEGFKQTRNFVAGLAGGVGLFTVVRSGFNTVKEFNQSIANLSAITGATGKDLDFLRDRAKELGGSTTLSATQVAEGFKLIASAKPELLENSKALSDVTEQAIILAEAAGLDLPEAASALANSLNQFGADADQAGKFVDVLAAGAQKGAGDINFLNTAFVKAGTVASDAGLSFVESAAALEVLAEKGTTAETAGTNFRNILLNLQKEGFGFESGVFNLQDALAAVNNELESIEDPAQRAARATKLFGKQNIASAKVLLDNTGRLTELTSALDENGIAAQQQATNTDTLQGALAKLQSAWEELVLDLSDGAGEFISLKDIINFLADNLVDIVKVVVTATAAFAGFKAGIAITKVVQNVSKAFKGLKGGITAAIKSFKALDAATRANAIGALVGVISGVVTAFGLWGNSSERVKTAQEKLNAAIDESLGKVEAEMQAIERSLQVANDKALSDEQRQNALDELKETYPEYLGFLELETLNTKEATEAIQRLNKSLQLKAKINATTTVQEEDLVRITQLRRALSRGTEKDLITLIHGEEAYNKVRGDGINVGIRQQLADQARAEAQAEYLKLSGEQTILQEEIIGFQKELGLLEEENANRGKKNAEENLKNAERTVGIIEDEIKALQAKKSELFKIGSGVDVQKQIDALVAEKNAILGVTKATKGSAKAAKDTFDEKLELQKLKVSKMEEGLEKELQLEEIRRLEEKKSIEQQFAGREGLNEAIQIADKKHTNNLIKIFQKFQGEIEKLDIKPASLMTNAEKERKENEKREKDQRAFAAISAKIAQKRNEDEAKAREEAEERKRKALEQTEKVLQGLNQIAEQRAQKRLELIDEEIAKSQERENRLKESADRGDLVAEKAITSELKRQEKLEAEKRRIERQQQLRELALAAFSSYKAQVEKDPQNALVNTLRDLSLLTAAIGSLPLFFEGTEDTGKGGALDQKGGFAAILHPHERVMTAEQNKSLRGLSNEAVVDMVNQFRNNSVSTDFDLRDKALLSMPSKDGQLAIQMSMMRNEMAESKEYMKQIASKPVYLGTNWNNVTKAFEEMIHQQGKLEKRIQKPSNGF